ncbi:MAG: nucleotide exchange factor GrpE [Myxococcota bacterium]
MSVGENEAQGGPQGEANGAPAPEGTEPEQARADAPAEPVEAEIVELAPEPSPQERRIAELEAEVAQLKGGQDQSMARLRAVSKAYTELQAEMKGFRERMEQRSKQDSELQSFEQIKVFFEPVMNLRRSLVAAQEGGGEGDSLLSGLRMVEQQFIDALKKLGLVEVPGVGSKFDPNVHEALGLTPVSEPEQDGIVLVVHTTGYAVGSRVLQAAQVVIGKYEEAAGEA